MKKRKNQPTFVELYEFIFFWDFLGGADGLSNPLFDTGEEARFNSLGQKLSANVNFKGSKRKSTKNSLFLQIILLYTSY